MFWSRRSKRISLRGTWSKHRILWSCRSKHISLVRTWLKLRWFGRAGRNVSRAIKLGQTWSKQKGFGRAGPNVSRLVDHGRNIDVLVAQVKTYLAGSNLVET